MPPQTGRALVQKGLEDYERALELQADHWRALDSHSRGELLFGLAEGYSRALNEPKARAYFERIRTELPGTAYAMRADTWLENKSLTRSQTACVRCHTGK